MIFEWDEAKRQTNIRKHGIDFADVSDVFNGNIIIIEDTRIDYGEPRYIVIGILNGRVIVVAYTEREDVIRIISARKATSYEQLNYFTQIYD